jgi:osmotically inducible protein OsmC
MALSNGLAQAGHPAEQLDTEAVAAFERTDAGWRLTTMALLVRGNVPGMDAATFAEQAAAAKDGCPVSNALKGNVEITVDAALV